MLRRLGLVSPSPGSPQPLYVGEHTAVRRPASRITSKPGSPGVSDVPSEEPHPILLVAHHTAATPRLVEQVRTRARHGSCSIVLLAPGPYRDPETEEAAKVIELALPLLEEAGGSLGSQQSSATATRSSPVLDALERSDFDEVIISTLPQRVSRWPRQDLPARVERQGLPVVVVTASQSDRAWGS